MKIKDLYHIYQLQQEESFSKKNLLDNLSEESKEKSLIEAICQSEDLDDETVARRMLNTTARDKSFRKLRLRLKDRLLNSLLFLEKKDERFPPLEDLELKCEKMLLQAKVLYKSDALSPAQKILLETLKLTTTYDFLNLTYEANRLLASLYARKGEQAAFQKYDRQARESGIKVQNELELIRLYKVLQSHWRHSVDKRAQLLPQMEVLTSQARQLSEQLATVKAQMIYARLLTVSKLLSGDFQQAVDICDEQFEQYLDSYRRGEVDKLDFFVVLKLCALSAQGKIDEGYKYALEYMEMFRENRALSYLFLEYLLSFCLSQPNYRMTELLLQSIFRPMHYFQLMDRPAERWKLYRCFYEFAWCCKHPEEPFDETNWVCLQELKFITKDKKGGNFHLQILLTLQQLLRQDAELYEARVDNLKVYASRYLKANRRGRILVRILNLIRRQQQEGVFFQDKFDELLKDLRQTPHPGLAHSDHEVIRYELLAELAFEFVLKKKEAEK